MPDFTILIVDNDLSICQILSKILKKRGYTVVEAHTLKEGRAAFEQNDIDAVLLDMMLPDGNGVELAKELLPQRPETPIILISAHATVSRAVEATKYGIYDFIEKPFEKEQILLRLRNALAFSESQKALASRKVDTLKHYYMIGVSQKMLHLYEQIEKIAPMNTPVLILGENGVGKELAAMSIHEKSQRAKHRMVKINCSAIPEELIEAELFGFTKGAFTGAYVPRQGRVLEADKGTLFLDEIGDLSLSAQAKVLRFLENGEVQRIGTNDVKVADVRIIAATNKNLQEMIKAGTFRQDLYYRIDVFPLTIPPLRERRDDIPLLVQHFVSQIAEENGLQRPAFSQAAMHFLCGQDWDGNVRQLRHFLERLLIIVNSELVDIHHLRALWRHKDNGRIDRRSLKEARLNFEREYIQIVLAECGGNKSKAAKVLGLDRGNFYRKIKELGI